MFSCKTLLRFFRTHSQVESLVIAFQLFPALRWSPHQKPHCLPLPVPMSMDRVVCIPVKLDISVHLEMLQECVRRLENGLEMTLTVQVITRQDRTLTKSNFL